MMLLGGRIKKIKNLLEGSLTVALPQKGEGVPSPTVYPTTRQKHTQAPFVKMTNVTHIHVTLRSHKKLPQKPIMKPENLYPYRKIYVISPIYNNEYLITLTLKENITLIGSI